MVSRLFLVYALAEVTAVVGLALTIGLGWTLLLLLAAAVVGAALAGSQLKLQLRRLQSGLTTPPGGTPPDAGRAATGLRGPATDSALVALGTVLVVVPGLVSTLMGLLLLLPPTRAVARPLLSAMIMRGISRSAPLITVVGADRFTSAGRPPQDYVDGEVVDVTDVAPSASPPGGLDRPASSRAADRPVSSPGWFK
ncbi:MAG: FxsA family protein [Mycobacterium sp.]|nr:FxsA family protein [Mycobacterium sp.]